MAGDYSYPRPPVKEVPAYYSNCYAYAEYILGDLPSMVTLQKTASPAFGKLAVFDYNGIPHVAVVDTARVSYGYFTITESNFGVDAITTRNVSFADPHLLGFIQ